jgi:hypothetical protein
VSVYREPPQAQILDEEAPMLLPSGLRIPASHWQHCQDPECPYRLDLGFLYYWDDDAVVKVAR